MCIRFYTCAVLSLTKLHWIIVIYSSLKTLSGKLYPALFLMQWSGNPLCLKSYIGSLNLELYPLPNYSGIHSKVVVWITPWEWIQLQYFEREFPLQNKVILKMTPKRVDFHSCTFREQAVYNGCSPENKSALS